MLARTADNLFWLARSMERADYIARTIEGVGEVLQVYKKALEDGVEKYLVGRPVKPVFRKFN